MAKNFDQMKYNFIYSHELWWLTDAIKKGCEELFQKTPLPEKGYYLKVDYKIHALINNILSDAANVKKLISIPKHKTKEESSRQFNLHIERSKYLMDKLKGIELSEITSVKLRNTLQHFDEYFDQMNIEASEGKLKQHVMAFYNIVLSHWEAVDINPYPLRVYISSEKKYYNMKAMVNIGMIYKEASSINDLLTNELNKGMETEPGGFIVPLHK